MALRLSTFALLAALTLFHPQARAGYVALDVTCASCGTVNFSLASGVNNGGNIVGYFANGDGRYYGFYYQNGAYSEITISVNTFPEAINNNGVIAGYYNDGTYDHGFELTSAGTLSTISLGTNTRILGINDSGQYTALVDGVSEYWDGTAFHTLTVPGYSTDFTAINNLGVIAGDLYFPSWVGLIRKADGTMIYPLHPPGTDNYGSLYGINDNGLAVGVWNLAPGVSQYYGYYYDMNTGDYALMPAYPGSDSTYPMGINTDGLVVGYFHPASGDQAFEYTPEPSTLLLVAGAALALWRRRREA